MSADMSTGKAMLACGCAANAKMKVGGEWVPSCCIHDCTEQITAPSLDGRMAKCCAVGIRPSNLSLAFFEYRGPGSSAATKQCKCGYYESAHPTRSGCNEFVPHGSWETDVFYCGHAGWD